MLYFAWCDCGNSIAINVIRGLVEMISYTLRTCAGQRKCTYVSALNKNETFLREVMAIATSRTGLGIQRK